MTNNEIVTPNEPTRSEKTKNNKRRILLIMLLLVCTLTLLGGATYAWFTANTKVAIADLDIEVTVADGIEISADAKNWGIKLNYRDLLKAAGMDLKETTGLADSKTEDAGSINVFPEKLKNVSSIGNIDTATNRLEIFEGLAASACEINGVLTGITTDGYEGADISKCDPDFDPITALVKNNKYVEPTDVCAKNGNKDCSGNESVMAFDIYLKLDNTSTVSLAPESVVKDLNAVDNGLKNTVRIAFETLGTQPNAYYNAELKNIDADGRAVLGKDAQDYYDTNFGGLAGVPGARRMNSFGNIMVWEPNYNYHTDFGIANASKYDISTTITNTTGLPTHGIHTEIPASKLPMDLKKADGTNSKEYFAEQKNIAAADATNGYKNAINYITTDKEYAKDGMTLFTAPAGVTKVRVYIWIEGNDIDTENNATSSKVAASLYFTTAGTDHDGIDAGTVQLITGKYGTSLAPVWRGGFDVTKNDPIKGTNGQEPVETETETEPAVTP